MMETRFNPISHEVEAELRSLIPSERLFLGDDINDDFCHDEMEIYGKFRPEAVVKVISTEEVSAVMRLASKHHIAVTPRGTGTGLCGGAVALHGGIILSLELMNRIIEIDEGNMTATCESGVLLMELQAEAIEHGLMYPPDPGEKTATVGGNVATNAGGMRAVKYGVTRDYVLGLEAVLPSGEIVRLGGKVAKNSSGYSLLNLLIGSEGTLAIITTIIFKLIPLPAFSISLLAPFPDVASCIRAVPRVLLERLQPVAVEFLTRDTIIETEAYLGRAFPDKSADSYLLLSFDGNTREEVDGLFMRAAKLLVEAGAEDALMADTEERIASVWDARGAFLEAIKCSTTELDECDVVVPRENIALFLEELNKIEIKHGLRVRMFGHAGDGNLHIYLCRDAMGGEEWLSKLAPMMDAMYESARSLGGQVSGEHGIGHAKKDYLLASAGSQAIAIMRGIKCAFDPEGILNPGKVV